MRRAPGIPHALCILGRIVHAQPGRSAPRECGGAFDENERATLSAVIVRHRVGATRRPMTGSSGRSSIPETLMIKSRGRGVLDRPVKPDDDNFLWSDLSAVAQRAKAEAANLRVVPANAGTHHHRSRLEQKASATAPKLESAAYGSPLSRGRLKVWHLTTVVPANAGTHNHRRPLEQKALATVPKRESAAPR